MDPNPPDPGCYREDPEGRPVSGGSGIPHVFTYGIQIGSIDVLRKGDVLIDYSRQFAAVNMVRVTRDVYEPANKRPDFDKLVKLHFVDPRTLKLGRVGVWDHDFTLWYFELDRRLTELYRPE